MTCFSSWSWSARKTRSFSHVTLLTCSQINTKEADLCFVCLFSADFNHQMSHRCRLLRRHHTASRTYNLWIWCWHSQQLLWKSDCEWKATDTFIKHVKVLQSYIKCCLYLYSDIDYLGLFLALYMKNFLEFTTAFKFYLLPSWIMLRAHVNTEWQLVPPYKNCFL